MTFKISEIAPLWVSLVVTFYFIINGIFVKGAIQAIAFFLIIISSLLAYKKARVDSYYSLWIFFLVPFLWSIKEWSPYNIRDITAYCAFVAFVIFGTKGIKSYKSAIKVLYYMAFFHLFFVFVNFLFEKQFLSFLYSIFDFSVLPYLSRSSTGGYCFGLGYIPGDTSGYFINGLLILFCIKDKIKSKSVLTKMLLLLIGVLLCSKRSHLLCLLLTLLIAWLYMAPQKEKYLRVIKVVILVIALLIIGYMLLPFLLHIPLMNRIATAIEYFESGQDFTSNRLNLISYAFQLFEQHKVLGIGWKVFNQFTGDLWGHTNYVNNIYVQLLIETGIIGAFLFFLPMAVTFIRTLKVLNQVKKFSIHTSSSPALFSFCYQIFFFLYGVFEIPFYDFTFLFVYGIAVNLANSAFHEINLLNKGGV